MSARLVFLLEQYQCSIRARDEQDERAKLGSTPPYEKPVPVGRLVIKLPARLLHAYNLVRSISQMNSDFRYFNPATDAVRAPWDKSELGDLRVDIVRMSDGKTRALFGKRRPNPKEVSVLDKVFISINRDREWAFLRQNPLIQGHINELILHLILASWEGYKKRPA